MILRFHIKRGVHSTPCTGWNLSPTHHFARLAECSSKHPPERRLSRSTWTYNDYAHALSQLFIQLQCLLQLEKKYSINSNLLINYPPAALCLSFNVTSFLQHRVIPNADRGSGHIIYHDNNICIVVCTDRPGWV